ncbi:hypothetical protein NUACC21_03950 [Scytonema sp. NUACC21]
MEAIDLAKETAKIRAIYKEIKYLTHVNLAARAPRLAEKIRTSVEMPFEIAQNFDSSLWCD